MRFVKQILACVLSALLFFVAWPPNSHAAFIFFAFIPLLWLLFDANAISEKRRAWRLYGLLFVSFLLTNFLLTQWVMNAHWAGGLFASFFNATIMSLVLLMVYKLKLRLGVKHAWIALPLMWLSFEYLHLHWDLTWPWLIMGNVFSEKISWIQWYEYTGFLGGSLWVLLLNMALYYVLKTVLQTKSLLSVSKALIPTVILLLPFYCSSNLMNQENVTSEKFINTVIVQPNFEPHHEKFQISESRQIDRVERLLDSVWVHEPDLIVLPETFLTDWIWEDRIENTASIKRLKSWLKNHPSTQILTGASTGSVLTDLDNLPHTARKSQAGTWYEIYNTALLISRDYPTQVYHKSVLVPGAEMTPYADVLVPILGDIGLEIGGNVGNFGTDDSIANLRAINGDFAPMICYESVFGDYVRKFVSSGAQWICVITNDGWWGDSYGYQQHSSYASLRAIENRRAIIRSANTGISSVINSRGEVEHFLPYGISGIISSKVPLRDDLSFYSQHGDYLGRLASFLVIIYFLQLLLSYLKRDKIDLKSINK